MRNIWRALKRRETTKSNIFCFYSGEKHHIFNNFKMNLIYYYVEAKKTDVIYSKSGQLFCYSVGHMHIFDIFFSFVHIVNSLLMLLLLLLLLLPSAVIPTFIGNYLFLPIFFVLFYSKH